MTGRLTRSRDAMIGGVAAGVANWIGADPTLVRIAWALLVVFTGGAALIAYIVAWVVVPEEPVGAGSGDLSAAEETTDPVTGETIAPAADTKPRASRPSDQRAGMVVGIGLVLVGLWFLLREYLPGIDWGLIWPLVVVGIGAAILVTSIRRRQG
jgi:phage shock protein C